MERLKRKKLFLMIGIPGSGKSTFIQTHKDKFTGTVKVISRDKIRFSMLGNNDDYFSKENEVWNEFVNQAKQSLQENDNTILDATHINISSRTRILRALKDNLKDVEICAIVIKTDLDTAIKQNNMREGRALVPEIAIRRMYHSFYYPDLEEGFDTIYIYDGKNKKITIRR